MNSSVMVSETKMHQFRLHYFRTYESIRFLQHLLRISTHFHRVVVVWPPFLSLTCSHTHTHTFLFRLGYTRCAEGQRTHSLNLNFRENGRCQLGSSSHRACVFLCVHAYIHIYMFACVYAFIRF